MDFPFLTDPELTRRVVSGIVIFFGTTVLSFVVGRWWGKYQAKKQWRQKQFLGRIIVSLNSLSDGWLKIRTIFERSLKEVPLNPVAIDKVRAASLRTTTDSPLLPIAKEDRWYLLNFVLNAVAERFSDSLMRYDAGQPLRPVTYLLFLTCEHVGEDRIRKVRAMLLQGSFGVVSVWSGDAETGAAVARRPHRDSAASRRNVQKGARQLPAA